MEGIDPKTAMKLWEAEMTTEGRRRNMRANRSKDTSPEIRTRKALHSMGYRFRIHVKDLSGKPDIVLPKHKLVIFVHGCFWHQHPNCKLASRPSSNTDYWCTKFERTRLRDKEHQLALEMAGWSVATIWECETREPPVLDKRLREVLENGLNSGPGEVI
ncbi:MAG: DNA mismatch endonuclease, patch repair protein [Marinobacter sp. T13-3]|nr:MAG: DNA mismatch endonuclease, patch repair protein [Marinobacter sp. T13-3]